VSAQSDEDDVLTSLPTLFQEKKTVRFSEQLCHPKTIQYAGPFEHTVVNGHVSLTLEDFELLKQAKSELDKEQRTHSQMCAIDWRTEEHILNTMIQNRQQTVEVYANLADGFRQAKGIVEAESDGLEDEVVKLSCVERVKALAGVDPPTVMPAQQVVDALSTTFKAKIANEREQHRARREEVSEMKARNNAAAKNLVSLEKRYKAELNRLDRKIVDANIALALEIKQQVANRRNFEV
jgi:hypothetical protein